MSGEHELLPDFLEVADSSAGKTKRRKSQSQQEFEAQKLIYKDGPVIQTEDVSISEAVKFHIITDCLVVVQNQAV